MGEPFVYHRMPDHMEGTMLYPLNQLKGIYPDAYTEHFKKYEGREHVLETRIPPPLDCLWNDVLHFTAVHPRILFQNLESAGFDVAKITQKRWFKIPVDLFNPSNTIVCLYRRDLPIVPDASDFCTFSPADMDEYRIVPQATIDYYKEQHALGKRPLLFYRIPHILFKGTIDTSAIEIIEV